MHFRMERKCHSSSMMESPRLSLHYSPSSRTQGWPQDFGPIRSTLQSPNNLSSLGDSQASVAFPERRLPCCVRKPLPQHVMFAGNAAALLLPKPRFRNVRPKLVPVSCSCRVHWYHSDCFHQHPAPFVIGCAMERLDPKHSRFEPLVSVL